MEVLTASALLPAALLKSRLSQRQCSHHYACRYSRCHAHQHSHQHAHRHEHQRGLTLLELLVTIAIVLIMAVLSMPLFDSLTRSHADTAMHYLMREVQQARSSAVVAGKTVTLCGSEDNESCSKNWQTGMSILVFIDIDANRRLDDGEQLIRASNVPKGYFQWRGAGRHYLRFRRDGSVREMGTFTYCPPTKDADFARQLTINRPGRSYYSRDRNGDRTHEANNSKEPIACPEF